MGKMNGNALQELLDRPIPRIACVSFASVCSSRNFLLIFHATSKSNVRRIIHQNLLYSPL